MASPDSYKRPNHFQELKAFEKNVVIGKARLDTIERTNKLATLNRSIEEYSKKETELQKTIKRLDGYIKHWTEVARTATSGATIRNAEEQIALYKKQRANYSEELRSTVVKLGSAKTERNRLIEGKKDTPKTDDPKTPKGDGTGTEELGSPDSPSGLTLSWQYNPPMVQAAYLNPKGLQQQDGFMPVGNPGTWDDAMDAWRVSRGSKGVIQMSRSYPYYSKVKNDQAVKVTENTTVYGFRFLYNPTSVTMSWGVGSEIDIAKFTAGSFRAAPITDAAMNSSITFSIILNRMLDMNHVTKGGGVIGNPYSVTLSQEDAGAIYDKGTMLDLEYLFRAVNGKDVDYNSSLNGKTADLGWLNSFPVELHLGSGLRYLVRVTQINVEHKIFNERMVPIFSTVDFICKRLPDLPATDDYRDTAAGGGGGGIAQVR